MVSAKKRKLENKFNNESTDVRRRGGEEKTNYVTENRNWNFRIMDMSEAKEFKYCN
jgi:hypothetical protein